MNQVLFRNLDEVKKNLDLNTKKILFLTSEGHIKRRSIDKLQPFISTKEILISPVEPLPSFKSILNLVEEIKGKKFDFLISLGGGSVIDTSKTLSLLLGNEDQPWDLFNTENIGKIKDLKSLRNLYFSYPGSGEKNFIFYYMEFRRIYKIFTGEFMFNAKFCFD